MNTIISTSAEHAVGLEPGGPREDEHGLDVEQDEEQGEDVVADLALGPAEAHRVDARLVGEVLLRLPGGPDSEPRASTPPRSATATPPKIATVRYARRNSDTAAESSER